MRIVLLSPSACCVELLPSILQADLCVLHRKKKEDKVQNYCHCTLVSPKGSNSHQCMPNSIETNCPYSIYFFLCQRSQEVRAQGSISRSSRLVHLTMLTVQILNVQPRLTRTRILEELVCTFVMSRFWDNRANVQQIDDKESQTRHLFTRRYQVPRCIHQKEQLQFSVQKYQNQKNYSTEKKREILHM